MLSHSLRSLAFIRTEEDRARHKLQDLHFAAAADAGSKAYSVRPRLPWQALKVLCRAMRCERGDVGKDGRRRCIFWNGWQSRASIPK